MTMNTIGFTPSSNATGVGLQSPRKVKPIEEEVLDNKEKITTGDTVHFSENRKMKKRDKADETINDDDSIKLSAKRLEKAKAELKKEMNRQALYNKEIHAGKVAASWWGSLPLLIGPTIGLLSNVFVNPEKKAENRADVKAEYRSKEEGVEQEQKIKASKLKAAFVTALPQLAGVAITVGTLVLDKRRREGIVKFYFNDKTKSLTEKILAVVFGPILYPLALIGDHALVAGLAALLAGTSSVLVPLGYTLFEKPDKENFNKGL